jgi:serine protease AprX
MKKLLLISVFFALADQSFAQYACWIQFKDKHGTTGTFSQPTSYLSEKAIYRRAKQQIQIDSTDLPVSQLYVSQVLAKGATLKNLSKWLNGITVTMNDTSALAEFRSLPFVKRLELTLVPSGYTASKISKAAKITKATIDTTYGDAYAQIDIHNGRKLHSAGYRGKDMVIGVLDGGFYKADEISVFDSLRQQSRLLGVKNFADNSTDFFSISEMHGTSVLSTMAANLPGKMIGTAPDASYWLIRTEYSPTEYLVEVDNWVAGIEFADSVGVDIINSSLGYTEFNYSGMNYSYQTLDGKTSRASIAANLAARKGMIVVNAAGNDGNKSWHYISAPSDADSILCVGAIDLNGNHANFSSYGPSSDGRIKPDVSAVGYQTTIANQYGVYQSYGTSFASPIIAGLAACAWQSLPHLNNIEIINLMKRYSSLYQSPNDSLGYGIPNVYALYDENRIYTGVSSNAVSENTTAYFSGEFLIINQFEGENSTAGLYGIAGQKLGEWKWNGSANTTNWSSLPRGTYLLSVATHSTKRVMKVLKK